MSDLSIPGVSNKYKSDEMIKAIMDAERVPLQRLEDRKESYNEEKTVWQQVNRSIDRFRESANRLYGFQNPFQNLIAESSQESALSATVGRQASEDRVEAEVIQEARADRFSSASLPQDYEIPAGIYRYHLGDEDLELDFRGGDLDSFARLLNRRGKGLMNARVVRDTFDTKVLVISGEKTGADQRLFFDDAARALGTDMGMLKETVDSSFSKRPELSVEPGMQEKIPLSTSLSGSQVLEIVYTVENIPRDSYTAPDPPSGPQLQPPEGFSFGDARVQSSTSSVDLPEWEAPPPPPFESSREIFSIDGRPLRAIDEQDGEHSITIESRDLSGRLFSLELDNRGNTHRRISVQSLTIKDPEKRGDVVPARPVSTADDAILKIDGIEVRRSSNEIEDVIPGVTLQVHGPSDGKVELDIEPDREAIKNTLIEFVGTYNQLVTKLNILTSSNETVVNEIEYFSDEEREEALEQLGMFQGDSTFIQLKSRLQEIVTAPYETSADRQLAMLNQIGISSNSSGFGGGLDTRRLRGYLEINEKKLDEMLNSEQLTAIKELFGRDSDGDLVVDSGLGYDADQYARYYTSTGGLIATRISGINQRIKTAENDIDEMEMDLERKEQQLKIKFGRMESALNEMEENSRSLNNLNSSGQ